jgi:hypothetical protein
MILFAVDQVAGAEYIFPLLEKWRKDEPQLKWKVYASPVSSAFLKKKEIPHEELPSVSTELVEAILNQNQFTRALLSTSQGSVLEREFLKALKSRKIPAFQLVDNWVNFRKRFEHSGEPSPIYPDRILTLDEAAKDTMIQEGIPSHLIEIVGQPYFEYQSKIYRTHPITTQARGTLLVTQPVSRFYEKRLGYDELSFTEAVLEAWKNLRWDWRDLALIVHPAENKEAYRNLLGRYSSEIAWISSENLNLKRDYALVLGMFSSLMVQSVMAGVPCASVQIGGVGEDLCFLSRNHYIPKLTTPQELEDFLRNSKKEPGKPTSASERFVKTFDGSCLRLEKLLLNQISEGVA